MKQTSNKNKFSSSLIKNITILTSYNTNNILNTLYSKKDKRTQNEKKLNRGDGDRGEEGGCGVKVY